MAILGKSLQKYWCALRDFFWPQADPISPQEREQQRLKHQQQLADYHAAIAALRGRPLPELEGYAKGLQALLDEEAARRASVDTRLTALSGFGTLMGALLVGVLTSTVLSAASWSSGQAALNLAVVYLIMQLVVALRAAFSGLDRRGYPVDTPLQVLPEGTETLVALLFRQMGQCVENLMKHQNANDKKVTQMAVAYHAFRNFFRAALVFTVLVAVPRILPPTWLSALPWHLAFNQVTSAASKDSTRCEAAHHEAKALAPQRVMNGKGSKDRGRHGYLLATPSASQRARH